MLTSSPARIRAARMYFPPPSAKVRRFASEFIPASPTKTHRFSRHPRRSALTCSTVVTSVVLPGNTHERTGHPSRVTARPTTSWGTSLRPFFEYPYRRSAGYAWRPAKALPRCGVRSSSSISKWSDVVS